MIKNGHTAISCFCFTGHVPSIRDGTYVIIPLVSEFKNNCWGVKIVEQGQNRIKLCVNSVPGACVGRYTLNVVTNCQGGRYTSPCVPDNDIYMLFNPWCKGMKAWENWMDSVGVYGENNSADWLIHTLLHRGLCVPGRWLWESRVRAEWHGQNLLWNQATDWLQNMELWPSKIH